MYIHIHIYIYIHIYIHSRILSLHAIATLVSYVRGGVYICMQIVYASGLDKLPLFEKKMLERSARCGVAFLFL